MTKYHNVQSRLQPNVSKKEDLQELEKIQEHYVISPCDKLSHNFGLTCKALYMQILKEELESNNVYESVDADWRLFSYREALDRHKEFNDAHMLEHNDNLPYLYICNNDIHTMHKHTIKARLVHIRSWTYGQLQTLLERNIKQ